MNLRRVKLVVHVNVLHQYMYVCVAWNTEVCRAKKAEVLFFYIFPAYHTYFVQQYYLMGRKTSGSVQTMSLEYVATATVYRLFSRVANGQTGEADRRNGKDTLVRLQPVNRRTQALKIIGNFLVTTTGNNQSSQTKILENLRKSQEIVRNPRNFQKSLGNPKKSQEILENPRKFEKILENFIFGLATPEIALPQRQYVSWPRGRISWRSFGILIIGSISCDRVGRVGALSPSSLRHCVSSPTSFP